MTQLTRCPEGHFYDSSKFRTCPYCQQTAGPVKPTVPMSSPAPAAAPAPQAPSSDVLTQEDIGATQGYYDPSLKKPVVGWLVIVDGPGRGQDYRLCSGRNYIGRASNMDVILSGDPAISRSKHAIVVFDPVSRVTLCQAGESRELFYLNGKVVTETAQLKRGDVLTIGKTKLVFVPFCDESFAWDDKTEA